MIFENLSVKEVSRRQHQWYEIWGAGPSPKDQRRVIRTAILHDNPVTGRPEAFVPDFIRAPEELRVRPDESRLFVMGEPKPNWDFARAMYDAYNTQSGGVNFRGEPCPAFDDLPQAIKDNWLFTAAMAWHLFAPKEN